MPNEMQLHVNFLCHEQDIVAYILHTFNSFLSLIVNNQSFRPNHHANGK